MNTYRAHCLQPLSGRLRDELVGHLLFIGFRKLAQPLMAPAEEALPALEALAPLRGEGRIRGRRERVDVDLAETEPGSTRDDRVSIGEGPHYVIPSPGADQMAQ